VITIGVQADLSGPVPDIGWRQANAVQLAVDEINAAGGLDIGGVPYTVTLVYADSMCDPSQAPAAAQALLDAGVVAVVGDTCTSASLAAQPIFAAAGIPMVSASSTGPTLTDLGYTNTFRVITRDDYWPIDLAAAFYYGYLMDRAAIIEMDGFWGNYSSDIFSDTFTSIGGVITNRYVLTTTDDFTATLSLIQGEDAHVIYFPYSDGAAAGLLALAADNLGLQDTPIAWNTIDAPKAPLADFDAVAGAAAEMNFAVLYYRDPADMPGYTDFNAAYVAAGFPNYGDEAQMWGAFAYDAARIILAAIDRGDSTDPAVIRDEIDATADHNGVVGLYNGFDYKGDVIPQWGTLLRSLNGEWLNMYPYPNEMPAYDFSRVDEFDGTSLGPEWTWINEDPTHWSLTDNPGFLRITVQQTPQVNWLVQAVPPGDFDIQTRLFFTPTENFENAGLLLYQDTENFLMLGRAYCEFGYPVCAGGNGIYFDHVENGWFFGDNFAMAVWWDNPTYLRITRQGERYTGYVSQDGETWYAVGQHVMSPGIELAWMGLGTASGAQPITEIPADFDYFWLNAYYLRVELPLLFK
jgi:branched-chain amino acid transport system substrate-binding protein